MKYFIVYTFFLVASFLSEINTAAVNSQIAAAQISSEAAESVSEASSVSEETHTEHEVTTSSTTDTKVAEAIEDSHAGMMVHGHDMHGYYPYPMYYGYEDDYGMYYHPHDMYYGYDDYYNYGHHDGGYLEDYDSEHIATDTTSTTTTTTEESTSESHDSSVSVNQAAANTVQQAGGFVASQGQWQH